MFFASFFNILGQKLWEAVKIGGRDISSGIKEAIEFTPLFYVNLGNARIPVTDAMVSIFVALIVLIFAALFFAHQPKIHPSGRQALSERMLEMVLKLCTDNGLTEKQARQLMPWTLSMGLYIIAANLVSVLGFVPAAKHPVFPITLAAFTLVFIIVVGLLFVGIRGFLRSLLNPMPAMLPFNLLDYVIKPVSLAFRLFGNVFGAYILLEFISLVLPLIFPTVLALWFDIGDGIIQGLIFMFLTINYVGEIVEKSHPVKRKKAAISA